MVIFVSCCPILPRFFIWLTRKPSNSYECSNNVGASRTSVTNYNRRSSIRQPEKSWNADEARHDIMAKSARYQPLEDRVLHYSEMAKLAKDQGSGGIDLESGIRKTVRVETRIVEFDE